MKKNNIADTQLGFAIEEGIGNSYVIDYSPDSLECLARLEKSEPSAFKKAVHLIEDLKLHPRMDGLGHPEPLKGEPEGCWSRRITQKHRLVYQIFDETKVILVLRAYGHYTDK